MGFIKFFVNEKLHALGIFDAVIAGVIFGAVGFFCIHELAHFVVEALILSGGR